MIGFKHTTCPASGGKGMMIEAPVGRNIGKPDFQVGWMKKRGPVLARFLLFLQKSWQNIKKILTNRI